MNYCTCQHRAALGGALYCGYCGRAALLAPWKDARGRPVDASGIIFVSEKSSPSEIILILAADLPQEFYFSPKRLHIESGGTLRLKSAVWQKQRGASVALSFKWFDFHRAGAANSKLLTREMLEGLLPPDLLGSSLTDVLLTEARAEGVLVIALPAGIAAETHPISLQLLYNVRAAASGGMIASGDIALEQLLVIQPLELLKIESNDPRFESTGAVFLAIDGHPGAIAAELSARAGSLELGPDMMLFITPATAMPIPVESAYKDGLLHFKLTRDHLAQILKRPGGAAMLTVCAGRRLLAGIQIEVRPLQLGLRLFCDVLNFKFDAQRNWVAEGPSMDDPVAAEFSGGWNDHFVIDCVPAGGLENAALVKCRRINQTLEIKASLKPEWVYAIADRRQDGAHQGGLLDFYLRNKNNSGGGFDVRTQARTVRLFSLPASVTTAGREPLAVLNIDFGTTNTAAACWAPDRATPESVAIDGSKDIPTQIYYFMKGDAADYERSQIGEGARMLQRQTPERARFQSGLKTLLLSESKKEASDVEESVELSKGVERTPQQLCTDFLRLYLAQLAHSPQVDGRRIEKLTFTFPVTASHAYRAALKSALEDARTQAGFIHMAGEISAACDEATCGGLWWFNTYMETPGAELPVTLMVYDYGGGTTDISLLRFAASAADGGVVEVRVLGVAGMPYCGGDDVTWKMLREFTACSHRDQQPWLQYEYAEYQKCMAGRQNRMAWRQFNPSLFEFMDRHKIESLSLQNRNLIDPLIEKLALAGMSGKLSKFIGSETFTSLGARNESGRVGAIDFQMYRFLPAERIFFVPTTDIGIKIEGAWFFKLDWDSSERVPNSALPESPLSEAHKCIDKARRLLHQVLGEHGKADHLLVIGQASQTAYFNRLIAETMKEDYVHFHYWLRAEKSHIDSGPADAGATEDPKTCVTRGACIHDQKRENLLLVPTILRRIVYRAPAGFGTQQEPDAEVLKSDAERNAVYELTDKRVLQALCSKDAARLRFALDALGGDASGDDVLRLVFPENGGVRMLPGARIFAAVADPAYAEAYVNLPSFVMTQAGAVLSKKPGALCLAIWPEGEGKEALLQVYSYYV